VFIAASFPAQIYFSSFQPLPFSFSVFSCLFLVTATVTVTTPFAFPSLSCLIAMILTFFVFFALFLFGCLGFVFLFLRLPFLVSGVVAFHHQLSSSFSWAWLGRPAPTAQCGILEKRQAPA
jgi:hypothetical protein